MSVLNVVRNHLNLDSAVLLPKAEGANLASRAVFKISRFQDSEDSEDDSEDGEHLASRAVFMTLALIA